MFVEFLIAFGLGLYIGFWTHVHVTHVENQKEVGKKN